MLNIETTALNHVYLSCGTTDMRNSIDGLAAIVTHQFKLDPFSSSLFVFCNKQRDKIKILRWETTGFTLWYKRLENGKFQWPDKTEKPETISERQLRWLLDGLSVEQPKAHREVTARLAS
jgi:transposase